MKIDLYDCHDRLIDFRNDWEYISQGVQDCINNVPDEIKSYFYVFGHSRQIGMDERFSLFMAGHYLNMDETPTERMIWSPRISKPAAQSNSYLFKTRKGTDIVEVVWLLPKPELWDEYAPEKLMYNEDIWHSIRTYRHKRYELEKPDHDISEEDEKNFKRIIGQVAHFNQKEKPWKMV